ncbi:MAG: hypothetical protein FWE37_04525 [Spirochaetaceae bacterium]|nr:hypothetical protein [Spirochaetaceae bacterium]
MLYSRSLWVNLAHLSVRFNLFLFLFFLLGSINNFTGPTQTLLSFLIRFFSLVAFASILMVFFQLFTNKTRNKRFNFMFRIKMFLMLLFSIFSYFIIDFINTILGNVIGDL